MFAEGRINDAEAVLVTLLGEDNTNAAALILYAGRCLAERGELGEAQTVLDAVKSDEHKAALAGAKAQITFLRQAADLPDAADLKEAGSAQNPQDDEAAYQLSIQQLARQQYDAALEGLLKLFIRNRSDSEGLPHKTLLQVFELLGNDHPLVTVYRRKLFPANGNESPIQLYSGVSPPAGDFHLGVMAQAHQQALARRRRRRPGLPIDPATPDPLSCPALRNTSWAFCRYFRSSPCLTWHCSRRTWRGPASIGRPGLPSRRRPVPGLSPPAGRRRFHEFAHRPDSCIFSDGHAPCGFATPSGRSNSRPYCYKIT